MANRLVAYFSAIAFSLFNVTALAEALVDPTQPPVSIAAPVVAASGVEAAPQAVGLQSIIVSKQRRAAIIDGELVELNGKHGDAKLIEVNEGNVVLRSAQGRQVLTLFPEVKITKNTAPAVVSAQKAQKHKAKNKTVTHRETE